MYGTAGSGAFQHAEGSRAGESEIEQEKVK